MNVMACIAGIGVAVLTVTFTLLPAPLVVLPAGTFTTVPGFEFYPGSNHRAGMAGYVELNFTLRSSSDLTGLLASTEPFSVVVVNSFRAVAAQCLLASPAIPCANLSSVFQYPIGTSINLANPELSHYGSISNLPAGGWTIFLVNWNPGPAEVTTENAILATPV
jgi:hypothetical protein